MVEVICLYIITLASVVYMTSKLYEFVKADLPVNEPSVRIVRNKKRKK